MASPDEDLVQQNVQTIADMHARAEQAVSHHQRRLELATALLGRPIFFNALLGVVAGWVLLNAAAPALHIRRLDPPPFYWLQGCIGLLALLMAILILIKQNRMGKMAERRALLDLQVNLLVEQKVTKLIALVEELRRDIPIVGDRHDPQAEAMTRPVDPAKLEQSIEQVLVQEVAREVAQAGPDQGEEDE